MSEAIEVATKYLSSRAGGRVVSSKKQRLQSVVSMLWVSDRLLMVEDFEGVLRSRCSMLHWIHEKKH